MSARGASTVERAAAWRRPALRSLPQEILPFQRGAQQDSRFFPLPLQGALGETPQGRELDEREAAEELEIDQLRERQESMASQSAASSSARALESRDLETAAALDGAAMPEQVDDEIAHDTRGVGQELSFRSGGAARALSESQIGLVQDGRRTHSAGAATALQLAPRDLPQVVVEGGEERALRSKTFDGLIVVG
jgi:hypothetical protein